MDVYNKKEIIAGMSQGEVRVKKGRGGYESSL